MNALTQMRRFALVAAIAIPAVLLPVTQAHAAAPVFLSVRIGPPALPVYTQPYCPGDGYIWTPGYWAFDDQDGYYWVPGVWVLPPEPGLLWTPGYWAWDDDAQAYVWNEGYWAPEVGFYGGINYGFGYFGTGFDGGYWRDGFFYYNSRVTRLGYGFAHTYDRPIVIVNRSTVAFNGGRGGIQARANDHEREIYQQHHVDPTPNQRDHQTFANQNPNQHNNSNHGRPPVAAAATVNSFHDNPTNPRAAARPSPVDNRPDNLTNPNQPQQPQQQPHTNFQRPQNQPQPQAQPQQPQAQPQQPHTNFQRSQQQPQPQAQPQRPQQAQPQSRPAPTAPPARTDEHRDQHQ